MGYTGNDIVGPTHFLPLPTLPFTRRAATPPPTHRVGPVRTAPRNRTHRRNPIGREKRTRRANNPASARDNEERAAAQVAGIGNLFSNLVSGRGSYTSDRWECDQMVETLGMVEVGT